MIPNKKYEEIERYVNLEMTEMEYSVFEQEMAQSTELAKIVALYKDIPNQLNDIQANLDFNKKLQSVRDNYTKTSSQSTPWKWIFIGIISILVIGLIWQQFFNTFNSTEIEEIQEQPQQLPEDIPIASLWKNSEMPPAYITRSSENIDTDVKIYQNAHQLFTTKAYDKALNTLESINKSSDIYSEMLLLKGVILYELNKYDEAIQTYGDYLALDAQPQDMVLWYQALALIQTKQNDKAKINLQRIIDNDYNKATVAKEILDIL